MNQENIQHEFQRVRSKKEIDTLTIPIQMILDKNLTGNAVRLLQIMILYGERPKWILRQSHLMSESCLKFEAYTNAIKKLIAAGYVRRIRPFIPGKYTAYIYQYCSFPDFKDENLRDDSNNVCDEAPVLVSQTGDADQENPIFTSCLDKRSVKETTTTDTASPSCCSSEEDRKKHILLTNYSLNNFTIKAIMRFPYEQIYLAIKAFEQNLKNGLNPQSNSAYLLTLVKAGAKPNATKEDMIENLEKEKKRIEIETINRSAMAQKILIKCQGNFLPGYNFEVTGDMIFLKEKNGSLTPISLRESDSINIIHQFCKRNTIQGTF